MLQVVGRVFGCERLPKKGKDTREFTLTITCVWYCEMVRHSVGGVCLKLRLQNGRLGLGESVKAMFDWVGLVFVIGFRASVGRF